VIRVAATILVALQALLPPGMCVCQVVPCGPGLRHEALPSDGACEAEDSCRSCPAHGTADPATPLHTAATDLTGDHDHPAPAPSSPCPGCPVVSAGPLARTAILPATAQAPPPAALVAVLTEPSAPEAPGGPPLAFGSPGSPLFVRHCALLI
jgi:hypothetical protein